MRFPTTLLLLFYQLCCYHSVVVVVLGSDNFPGSTSTEDGWSDEEEGGSKLMPSKNDDNMPQVVYPRQMMMKYFPRFTGYNNPIVEYTTTTRNHRFSSSYNNLFRESVVVVDHTDNSKNTNIKMHYIQDAPVDKVWNYYTQPPLDYNHHNPKKDEMIEIGVSGPESTDNMIPSYNNNYGIPQRNEPPPSVEHFATNIPHSTVTDNEFIFNYENHLFENTSYNNVFDTLFQSGKDNNVHPQKIRFVPLSCNSKLQSVRCGSWVAKYGTASTHRKLIVIPCGQCITMDYYSTSGSSTNPPLLILEAGIDIVGKLVFPNNYRINLRTSMIVVQGELQMTSRKPVDGTPDIAILMIGNRNETFAAQYENKNICPNNRCLAGKKAITVAGGKITVSGLPPDTPTWVHLFDVANGSELYPTDIIVDASVKGKWMKGSEILITSHTQDWTGQQVGRIVTVSDYPKSGTTQRYVQIKLEKPIRRPTTLVQSEDFAAEVALLSRNILFKGGIDNVTNHGAHFWIILTPNVVQKIEGVEFVNFGQQGLLGRYPIHFHMSGSVKGSIVAKNSIRESNQRCIVVHGTNDLLIEDNVAYDTKGHCFVLEDGIETGNMFINNLGALTKIPEKLISSNESDNAASTFWITNPLNSFQGNVAGGSEMIGYWFEPMKRGLLKDMFPDLTPDKDPLTLFEGNVAHSNGRRGIQTYPTGYEPRTKGTATFAGIKSYRNAGAGLFFHISRNIVVRDALIADNKEIGIDIDRADAIDIIDTVIVGESASYRYSVDQQGAGSVCHFNGVYGIDLHTWKNNPDEEGITLVRVRFRGFSSDVCPNALPFRFDNIEKTGQFNLYTSLKGIQLEGFETSDETFDFCYAAAVNINDIYLNVLDGRVYASDSTRDPATAVTNSKNMLAFVNPSQCQEYKDMCYVLCRRHCFSSVRFGIDPASTEKFTLKVCKRGESTNCIFVSSATIYDDIVRSDDHRTFTVHLPSGSYEAEFLDEYRKRAWPMFVTQRDEHSQCQTDRYPKAIVQLKVPPLVVDQCSQLIRNPFMEISVSRKPKFWFSRFGSIEVVPSKGIGRSTAIGDFDRSNSATIGQFLDSRCIKANVGEYYELIAFIKLTLFDGRTYQCDADKMQCPEIGVLTSSGDIHVVAEVEMEVDRDGYQKANGFLKIDESMTSSLDPLFYFIRSNGYKKNILVDNVSMRLIEDPKSYCKNLIMTSGANKYWEVSGSGTIGVPKGFLSSSTSIIVTNRKQSSDGIAYKRFRTIEKDCLKPKSKWTILAQMKFIHPYPGRGDSCTCDMKTSCPQVQVVMNDSNGNRVFDYKSRNYTVPYWKATEFNQFRTSFVLPPLASCAGDTAFDPNAGWDGSIGLVSITVRNYPTECNLILDKFSFVQFT